MSLRDYCLAAGARDHFKADYFKHYVQFQSGLDFPCCCCVNAKKNATEEPCLHCDHNVNAEPEEPIRYGPPPPDPVNEGVTMFNRCPMTSPLRHRQCTLPAGHTSVHHWEWESKD